MNESADLLYSPQQARIIVMGCAELMEGFALLGFETWSNADKHDVETLMVKLLKEEAHALVLLESHLAHFDSAVLKNIRENSGTIIVTEIPAFHSPDDYSPVIDNLIIQALGPNALVDKDDE
jgi:vacuolar-type H+-ATPase subunit F/Vma7